MRPIVTGSLAGAGFGVAVIAALRLWYGHATPEDYLSEPLAWLSPTIAAGVWMLIHFGPIAAVAGGLIGGAVAAAVAAVRRMGTDQAAFSENAIVRLRDRVLAVAIWGTGVVLLTLACALGTFAAFAAVIDSDTAHRIVSRHGEIEWNMWMQAGGTVATIFSVVAAIAAAFEILMFALRLRRQLLDRRLLSAGVRGGLIVVPIFALIVFLSSWVTGTEIPVPAPIHSRSSPMSAGAAYEATSVTLVAVVLLWLPFFAIGAMLGAVVALLMRIFRGP
jgi:hypothetical protein